MMNWKMWQKCVGKMGKKLPIFLFVFILLYVIDSLICYPMLTKKHVLIQKEKYAEQAAKETVDRNASVRCLDDNTQALAYRLALIESAQRELIMTTFDMSDGESAFLRREQAVTYQEKSAYEKAGKPSRTGKYYKLPFR